ncbi:hypothetical protein NLI96_g7071 [Meripilus lineatus]|uniref:Uncharacterized protein n=1 Tax=Meripilus lineatus TaxID=2056292 RepID=A0AAD5YDA7_9APHY|nr:hypothetical protein NLI96_g7071 [Physisporinus lineatus]
MPRLFHPSRTFEGETKFEDKILVNEASSLVSCIRKVFLHALEHREDFRLGNDKTGRLIVVERLRLCVSCGVDLDLAPKSPTRLLEWPLPQTLQRSLLLEALKGMGSRVAWVIAMRGHCLGDERGGGIFPWPRCANTIEMFDSIVQIYAQAAGARQHLIFNRNGPEDLLQHIPHAIRTK